MKVHIVKVSNSLRASSPGSSGGRAGKGKRISIFSLKKLTAELTAGEPLRN